MPNKLKKPLTYEEEFVIGLKEALLQKHKKLSRIDSDEHLYRSSTSTAGVKLNIFYNHLEMLRVCGGLYDMNPVANWYINFLVDMILGGDVLYSSENEKVMNVLDNFWDHDINNMDIFAHQMIQELFIFGALCLPAQVTEHYGNVFIGYISPFDIKQIITDPLNNRIVVQIVCNGTDSFGKERIYNTVLTEDEELYISNKAKEVRKKANKEEQCFYFSVNSLIGDLTGRSELYVIADHLDKNEQFMFTLMERIPSQLAYIWDVEITGSNDSYLREWARNNPTPKSGSQRVHNEKVKYKSISPDIKATDMDTISRVFRNHILGAKSIPSFYFGDGADANKATSENMSLPSIKAIKRKQSYVKFIFKKIFDLVIKSALKAGVLTQRDDLSYQMNMIEVNPKNNKQAAEIFGIVTKSLYDAQISGWLTKQQASEVFANFIKGLGYEGEITASSEKEQKF